MAETSRGVLFWKVKVRVTLSPLAFSIQGSGILCAAVVVPVSFVLYDVRVMGRDCHGRLDIKSALGKMAAGFEDAIKYAQSNKTKGREGKSLYFEASPTVTKLTQERFSATDPLL